MKTVLITGASRGIGRATALLFQKNGWNVAATMREPEKESSYQGLKNVKCYRLDVTKQASIQDCIEAVLHDFQSIDVLVNNAGIYLTKPYETVTDDELSEIIETNIIGTMNMMKKIIPCFRKKRSGIIINISSVAGISTFPYQSVYHGTKWAVEGLSEGLIYELREIGVSIKLVEPGMVKTNIYEHTKNLRLEEYPKEYKKSFRGWHKFIMNSIRKGFEPENTAKTIYQAVTDHKKKFRYTSGSDTKLVHFMRSILPFSLYIKMIRKMSGMS